MASVVPASTNIQSPGRMMGNVKEVQHSSLLLDSSTLLFGDASLSQNFCLLSQWTDLYHMTMQGRLGLLLT